jgi:lipoprotein-anchoring transpeptidase ErfK/SrfK
LGSAAHDRYGELVQERWIRITIATQVLELLEGSEVVAAYEVSTSAKGVGERVDSGQTPRGRHEVKELIGQDAPLGAVFVGRHRTGEICTTELQAAHPDRDWILTRVIWLGGMEDGKNRGGEVDTFSRYIYIHGTPDREPVGEPRSHGCIRMRNADVTALFDQIEPGMLVQIDE